MGRDDASERRVLTLLVLVVVALAALKPAFPDLNPISALVLPVMYAGWRLSRRSVVILGAVTAVAVGVEIAVSPVGRTIIAGGVVLVTIVIAYRYAALRERWGLTATQGVGILLDLRDRLRQQGDLTSPPGWTVGSALRSAGDDAMRGDFTLAVQEDGRIQVVVVDVSGHGAQVAARASLLAGAFGGLIGAVAPEELLPACNAFVCRQGWTQSFATAVHLVLDTRTGEAEVRTAGHPPAYLRRVDGTWRAAVSRGPVLGLRPDPSFEPARLAVQPGEVILLLSDGLVDEVAQRPVAGVQAAVDGWTGDPGPVGVELLADVRPSVADDQALIVLLREADAS